MSFLGRFLGGRSSAFSEGMALLEEERFADAADRFRASLGGRSDAPSDSLAAFHFRQALVSEGRRLLRANQPENAAGWFAEAVSHWDLYPDLHCLLGTARGRSGDWENGLLESRAALRQNPDYIEARLLEATALAELGREREAIDSLEKLRESGRRVDHWLIDGLGETGLVADSEDTAQPLATALGDLLDQATSGRSEKEDVAAAVAECRAGRWEEGLVRFAKLVARRPRYPDYRTRHAAALFQLGRNEEALAEADAALALNDSYRTAIDLKGLILADGHRVREARRFLASADLRVDRQRDVSGDLFGLYLRGVLALLDGEPGAVESTLPGSTNLVREFARAELLLAAAEDLQGRTTRSGERLALLAQEWPAEPIYFHLLACHYLRDGRPGDAVAALGNWPASAARDDRPLFLGAVIEIERGRAEIANPPEGDDGQIAPAAWRFLGARAAFARGDHAACFAACAELVEEGLVTERVVGLMLQAAARGDCAPEEWQPPMVHADSHLPSLLAGGAEGLGIWRAVHPEWLVVHWLSPGFWLDPIRGWIG